MALFTTMLGLYGGVLWCGELQGSPSELNVPTVASKRSASFFFSCVLFGGQSRTESSPGALRSFCGSRGEAPPPPAAMPPVPRSVACATFRACHQLRLLLLLALLLQAALTKQ
jgi:hypothetical protein